MQAKYKHFVICQLLFSLKFIRIVFVSSSYNLPSSYDLDQLISTSIIITYLPALPSGNENYERELNTIL